MFGDVARDGNEAPWFASACVTYQSHLGFEPEIMAASVAEAISHRVGLGPSQQVLADAFNFLLVIGMNELIKGLVELFGRFVTENALSGGGKIKAAPIQTTTRN